MVDLLHEDNAMNNEGFEIAAGQKRRIDSSNSFPTEKIYRKIFLKTDTGKLNASWTIIRLGNYRPWVR